MSSQLRVIAAADRLIMPTIIRRTDLAFLRKKSCTEHLLLIGTARIVPRSACSM